MNVLTLGFTSNNPNPTFEILLDDSVVEFTQTDNTIIILYDIWQGFHLLEIQSHCEIQFITVELDDVQFGDTIFTMFAIDQGKRIQTTSIRNYHQSVFLPFINPIASWISSVSEKIPSTLLAGNLYDEFDVYYPTTLNIGDHFPKLIKDYFKYNLDFTAHIRPDNSCYSKTVPYYLTNIVDYNEQELYTEFMANLPELLSHIEEHQAGSYLVTTITPNLSLASIDLAECFLLDKTRFPKLYSLLENIGIGQILQSFVGILAPDKFIPPHTDNFYFNKKTGMLLAAEQTARYMGCSQVYIPINFKVGNFFKMTNVGLLPLDQGPLVVNNHNYSHALINDSNEYRFAIAIVGSDLHEK